MRVPIKWLKQFIDLPEPVEEIVARLGEAGFEVEDVWRPADDIRNVIVGQIKKISRHPNADRLSVCDVDVSQSPVTNLPNPPRGLLKIVTGAANVVAGSCEGSLVPVAIDGASVAGGKHIRVSELRGQLSQGMLCSLQELGLEETSSGVALLDGDYLIGQNIMVALGFDEPVLEINVLPNRPDCLSILGMARELGALYQRPVRFEDPAPTLKTDQAACPVSVVVEDIEGCSRYMGRYVAGVQIGPSPAWLQSRLRLVGLRPINNVVDVTNYVLYELGQPLHAFDADTIADKTLWVRKARPEEKIDALNDQDYALYPDDLVIADAKGPVALAGVMGGRRTATTAQTVNVFLEAAQFNSRSVRRAVRRHRLSSDSSVRFERGVDFDAIPQALDRAASLLQDLARGIVRKPLIDQCFHQPQPVAVRLRYARLNRLLGYEIAPEKINAYFRQLGFKALKSDAEGVELGVPSFRSADVFREADLIEEVLRLDGLGGVPATLPQVGIVAQPLPPVELARRKASQALAYMGFYEAVHFSMVSTHENQRCHLGQPYPSLNNPINPSSEQMRSGLLAGLLRYVHYHLGQQITDLAVFEVGKIFRQPDGETWVLAALAQGLRNANDWRDKRCWDLFAFKAVLEHLCAALWQLPLEARTPVEDDRFHQGQSFYISVGGKSLGVAGKIHPVFAMQQDLPAELFYFELNLDLPATGLRQAFRAFSGFPAVRRDASLIVSTQNHAALMQCIRQAAGDLLETVQLKDIFEDAKFGAGRKNYTYTLTFRHPERTLTDEEVNAAHERIKAALHEHLGIEAM